MPSDSAGKGLFFRRQLTQTFSKLRMISDSQNDCEVFLQVDWIDSQVVAPKKFNAGEERIQSANQNHMAFHQTLTDTCSTHAHEPAQPSK